MTPIQNQNRNKSRLIRFVCADTILFISDVQPVSTIMKEGNLRRNIHPGDAVAIILKKDQGTGALTFGRVADILTNSPNHPHGIKVRLTDGSVGRVKEIY